MHIFKEAARIPKATTKLITNEISISSEEYIKHKCYSSCPHFHNRDFCSQSCILHSLDGEITTPDEILTSNANIHIDSLDYIERSSILITRKVIKHKPIRLPKSMILQYLYFMFTNIDTNGFIRNFDVDRAADDLGFCSRTIEDNLHTFSKHGFLLYSRIAPGRYSIYIDGYKNLHKEGSEGYFYLTKDAFLKVIASQNVNSIRLGIRKLVSSDSAYKTNNESTFKNTTMKLFLPKFIKSRSQIKKINAPTTNLFEETYDGQILKFKLHDKYSLLAFTQNILHDINCMETKYKSIYNTPFNIIGESLKSDLVQMSIQYGKSIVIEIIDDFIVNYYFKDKVIENPGGFIRSMIEKSMRFESIV